MAQWYTYPRIDNYAFYPDPDGNFPKPDSNLSVPDGTPITALLPGTVSGVNTPGGGNPSWGAVVTVKLDNPINALATYTAYLHMTSTSVQVGQRVLAGDVVGYAGPDAMGLRYRLGFALCSGPYYGIGAGFSNVGSAALNPVPLLDAAKNGSLNIPSSYAGSTLLSSVTGGISTTVSFIGQNVHTTLNTVPGFVGIVEALDEIEQFQPMTLTGVNGNLKLFGQDTGIPNLQNVSIGSDAMQAGITFIAVNTRAFSIRALLVLIGLIIVIGLVMNATGMDVTI